LLDHSDDFRESRIEGGDSIECHYIYFSLTEDKKGLQSIKSTLNSSFPGDPGRQNAAPTTP
ncbi:MAG: hypothetical protein LBL26_13020, partial [Peptococcaceae bacterium]|nr:hypothetical protein [Peptococcaceae bacterium]